MSELSAIQTPEAPKGQTGDDMTLEEFWIGSGPDLQEARQATDFSSNYVFVDHFSVLDYYLDWSPVSAATPNVDPPKE